MINGTKSKIARTLFMKSASLKSGIGKVMAAAALHPCVGHVYADAVAITAFDPRTTAKRHLHMALLTARRIDDPQVARLDLSRGDCPQVTGAAIGGCITG